MVPSMPLSKQYYPYDPTQPHLMEPKQHSLCLEPEALCLRLPPLKPEGIFDYEKSCI